MQYCPILFCPKKTQIVEIPLTLYMFIPSHKFTDAYLSTQNSQVIIGFSKQNRIKLQYFRHLLTCQKIWSLQNFVCIKTFK